jgi:hypothetical protein
MRRCCPSRRADRAGGHLFSHVPPAIVFSRALLMDSVWRLSLFLLMIAAKAVGLGYPT